MVASAAEYFRDPSLRPSGIAVCNLNPTTNVLELISAYHLEQFSTVSDLFLTGDRVYNDWGIKPSIRKAKALLKNGNSAIISLVWKAGTNDCLHAVLGYKIVKVKDRDPVIYIYDPNHPATTTIANTGVPVGMHQLILARDGSGWNARGPMSYAASKGITRYSNGISVFPVQKGFPAHLITTFKKLAYQSVITMTHAMFSQNKMGISLQCPADLLITDSNGGQIGIAKGRTVNTIPGAQVVTTGLSESYRLPRGNAYTLNISGTDTGIANLSFFSPTSTNQLTVTAFTNLPLTAGCQLTGSLTTHATIDNISNHSGTLISPDLQVAFTNRTGTVTGTRALATQQVAKSVIPEIRSKANTPFTLTTPAGETIALAAGAPPPNSLLAISCHGRKDFMAWSDGRWLLAGQHGACQSVFGKGITLLSVSVHQDNIDWTLRHSLEPGERSDLLFRPSTSADWQTIARLIAE